MNDKDLRSQLEGLFSDLEGPGVAESHHAPLEGKPASQEGARPGALEHTFPELEPTDAALRESESRLRTILDNVQTGILIIDPETHTIVDVNPAAVKLIGAPREQILGSVCHKYVCPADKGKCPITDLGQRVDNSERVLLTAGGGRRPIIKTVSTVMLGGRVHLLESFIDITERKRAEEESRVTRQQLSDIIDFLPDATFVIDQDKKLIAWNRVAEEMTGVRKEDVLGQGDYAYALAFWGERRPVLIDFIWTEDPEFMSKYTTIQKKGDIFYSEVFVPRVYGGRGAVLWATATHLLDSKGNKVGAIECIRDVTERKQAEEVVAQERNLLRTLIDNLPDFIYVKDTNSRFTLCNNAIARRMGVATPDELVGKSDKDWYPQELAARYYADEQAIMQSGQPLIDHEEPNLDEAGNTTWISTTKVPLRDSQGKVAGLVGIGRDITKHKQAEEALAQEHNLWRSLIDSLPDLIYVKDPQSRFAIVNQAQVRLLGGTTPDDLLGKSDFDFFPHEMAQKYYSDEQAILQSGHPMINVEEPTTDAAGNKKWLSTTKVPLRDSNGQITGLVGVGRDITERKQAEEALRESEEKYRTILESMQEGYFEVDIAGNFTFLNDALCRVLGYPRDELMGMNNREYMDAENAKAVYRVFNETYRTRKPSPTSSHEVIRKDGARRSIEMSTSLITDSMGKPTGFRGILRDITERKRAEEILARRATQLQTAAEVSRAASSILTVDELLTRTVELIRDRFNLYYVGIFLVDETDKYAVLRAGTGEAGRKMIEAGHKLEEGGASMVGWCIANRQARIALDVGQEAVRFANPLLPRTRSEMALPLISRDRVIGAMTIQSDQPAAFAQEDTSILQSMADQAANAIENARLFEESQRRAAREQMLNTMAARVRAGLTLDQVLNTTVQQVGATLGAARVAVRLKAVHGDSPQTMAQEKEG